MCICPRFKKMTVFSKNCLSILKNVLVFQHNVAIWKKMFVYPKNVCAFTTTFPVFQNNSPLLKNVRAFKTTFPNFQHCSCVPITSVWRERVQFFRKMLMLSKQRVQNFDIFKIYKCSYFKKCWEIFKNVFAFKIFVFLQFKTILKCSE